MPLTTFFRAIRPPFLLLTPVCIFLGLSTSLHSLSSADTIVALLVLLGAVCAHISVNTLNEYHDFKSGLDIETSRTPFSGGRGALPANPAMASRIRCLGLASLLLTVAIGCYLVVDRGIQILPVGLAGIVLVVSYTPWLNRMPLAGLVAPGLGFGVLMVVGSDLILTGRFSDAVWRIALVPFCLINNLLLLNQYPDLEADAKAGRNTFPIAYGLRKSHVIYAIFALAAYAWIPVLIARGHLPTLGVIAVTPAVLSLIALTGAIRFTTTIGDHPRFLAANVAAALLAPLLLGIAIIFGNG